MSKQKKVNSEVVFAKFKWDNRNFKFRINRNSTIADLREKIAEFTFVPPKDQTIVGFVKNEDNEELNDDSKPIKFYNNSRKIIFRMIGSSDKWIDFPDASNIVNDLEVDPTKSDSSINFSSSSSPSFDSYEENEPTTNLYEEYPPKLSSENNNSKNEPIKRKQQGMAVTPNKSGAWLKLTVVFIFAFVFLMLLLFGILILVLVWKNNTSKRKTNLTREYSYIESDVVNGRMKKGRIKSHRILSQQEFISYSNQQTGSQIFISNFGGREFGCRGSCSCGKDVLSNMLFSRMTAFSSTMAIKMANEAFSSTCSDRLLGCKNPDSITSEILVCGWLSDEEDVEEFDWRWYFCHGVCLNNPDLVSEEAQWAREDWGWCNYWELQRRIKVDCPKHKSDEDCLPNAAKTTHDTLLKPLCAEISPITYEDDDGNVVNDHACVGGEHLEIPYDNIVCERIWEWDPPKEDLEDPEIEVEYPHWYEFVHGPKNQTFLYNENPFDEHNPIPGQFDPIEEKYWRQQQEAEKRRREEKRRLRREKRKQKEKSKSSE